MDDAQSNKPPCNRADALAVLRTLRNAGHLSYFAGGCVRDLLLGLEPKDFDLATDAPPQRVRSLFPQTQSVGASFGVILVRQGRSVVEVATFRAEGPYLDGRRPSEVRFTTAEEDAQRRDFTINGLFLDPLDDDRVIDYVGGQADLADRRLRAIRNPAERFAEDHLRLLRAVRFAARFGLEIEPKTAAAMLAHAPLLKGISPERIGEELRLTLRPPTRNLAWPLLWQFRLVDVIFRFVPLPPGVRFSPERSVFLSTAPGAAINFGLALAAASLSIVLQEHGPHADLTRVLSHDGSRKAAQAIDKAMRLSNEEFDQFQHTLEGTAPLLQPEPPSVASLMRFLARPTAANSIKLLSALGKVGVQTSRIDWLNQQFAALEGTEVAPAPLLSGDDLTAAGLKPGPAFRAMLDGVYDAQLEGRVSSREEALRLALELLAKQSG